MNLITLNEQYGIPEQVKITQKNKDVFLIEVTSQHAQATISTHGGQVLSFIPASETHDLLFVSKLARFEQGRAIRGGIPICWPWFGPNPDNAGPAHGLVRTRQWQLRQTTALADGAIKVILEIHDNDETRAIWPHSFDLSIEITIHETLTLELVSRNTGANPFELTQALHSYFYVGDCQQAKIKGLDNTSYIDKTDAGKLKPQRGYVSISQEVDRIYTHVAGDLILEDPVFSRNIQIQSRNSSTVILWNPWKQKAARMSDLGQKGYESMVCIETANAGDEIITVEPDKEYHLLAQYQIMAEK